MTCGECKSWYEYPTKPGVGECRIRAPVVVAGEHGYESSDWPCSKKEDWCGEFSPKDRLP